MTDRRPIVKIWGLALDTPQPTLEKLHTEIVTVFMGEKSFKVEDEMGLVVLFPKDLMGHGLGSDILIEMETETGRERDTAPRRVAEGLVRAVKGTFSKALVVTCHIYPWRPRVICVAST